MKDEKLLLRMNLLGGMDSDIRQNVSDEEYHMRWLALGVPDCATEDDLEFIAEDDERYAEVLELYTDIIKKDTKENLK